MGPIVETSRGQWMRWCRFGAAGAATFLLLQSPGCGGVVTTDGTATKDHGDSGAPRLVPAWDGGEPSGGGGRSGASSGGTTGKPPTKKNVCGDGHRSASEDCDGTDLGGATCQTVTMGAYPGGQLGCTTDCRFDPSRCRMSVGTGGVTGAGGARGGTGGIRGGGGLAGDNPCYQNNGVPTQGTGGGPGCAYGYAADELCLGRTLPPTPSEGCAQICACNTCAGSYTRCMLDGACAAVFTCALESGCSDTPGCYGPATCASTIDRAGGLGSPVARSADAALSCFRANCSYPCGAPVPVGR